jgi:outer membrane protein assembly factor BamB
MKKRKPIVITDNQFRKVLFVTFIILLAPVSKGQEWTRYRGPNGQGISQAKTIPVKWTEKDYNWNVNLPEGLHNQR